MLIASKFSLKKTCVAGHHYQYWDKYENLLRMKSLQARYSGILVS